MKQVSLFTDGSCSGNPGPGGWAAIIQYNGHEKVLSGGEPQTTNNRMELSGVIKGLEALKEPCEVTIYTDSKYFADAIDKGWLAGWKKNGWKRSKGELLNVDLWKIIDELQRKHKLNICWVKGHAGHPENERCDKIAVSETAKFL